MQSVGIYREAKKIKIAELGDKKKIYIEKVAERDELSPNEWPELIVTGIPSEDVLVRQILSPLKKRQALQKTLPFQLESLIPYSLREIIWEPIFKKSAEGTFVSFFVVSEKNLEKHLKEQQHDPLWVSCIPIALQRFAEYLEIQEENYIVFHLGRENSEIISVYQKLIQHSLTIPLGTDHLVDAYKKDKPRTKKTEDIDLHSITKKEYPHLVETLKAFQQEVDRVFCFLKHKKKEDVKHLIFCGETSHPFNLERYITSLDSFTFIPFEIQEKGGLTLGTLKKFAVPIGLALEPLKEDQSNLQFRKGKWLASGFYAEIKKRVLKTLSLSFCVAVFLFAIGHFVYQKQETAFLKEIDAFITEHVHEIPELKKVQFFQNHSEKISFLNQKIKGQKKDYLYFAPPPRVADVLAFLSTHPKLQQREGEKKMEMLELRYELLQFPSIQEPFKPYKVKVHLRFKSPIASWARDFHDALVEDPKWVDLEEEITWDRSQNDYTLAFVLKK